MILSFKHRGLKRLFERGDRSQIGADLIHRVENILATLDAANAPQALDLPGYRLHQLKGDRKRILGGYRARQLADHFPLREWRRL